MKLKKEGSESVTNCHQLKLEAADGKKYKTDVADPETLLRLIQSVPNLRAEEIFSVLSACPVRKNDPSWIKSTTGQTVSGCALWLK